MMETKKKEVSLTSIVCKMCESRNNGRTKREGSIKQTIWIQNRKVMCHQLKFLLNNDNIILERDGWVDCIYLDNVFDKVPHRRLQWKLEYIKELIGRL